MAVKFPLKMPDGTMVRTIEELREHFDLTTVLSYYDNGRLVKWLENGYYDEEAGKVADLDASSADFTKNLCGILGIEHSETGAAQVDLGDISNRNERLEHLKQYTADDAILAAVDCVAFTQKGLDDLLDHGAKEIYLCEGSFKISGRVENVTYIGVNYLKVDAPDNFVQKKIVFKNLDIGIEKMIQQAIDTPRAEDATLWLRAAERGSARAQCIVGIRYYNGDSNVEQSYTEAVKWYRKAAEQGDAEAQNNLGVCYDNGKGVPLDYTEAVMWFRKAAEQGYAVAQKNLGICFYNGRGVEQDYTEAVKWYHKAAEQGDALAQYNLGCCYKRGEGLEQNESEAIKWLQKAMNQGIEDAKSELVELAPKLCPLSAVILSSIGGRKNLLKGSAINTLLGAFYISVEDRYSVRTDLLEKYGAISVSVETKLYSYEKHKHKDATVSDVFHAFGGLLKTMTSNKPPDLWLPEEETVMVSEDLGGGVLSFILDEITTDMEKDFDDNIKPYCRVSQKETSRGLDVTMERLRNW